MQNSISILDKSQLTMSSREIAELTGSRHDSVKRAIERLSDKGVIIQPPMVDEQTLDKMGRPRAEKLYLFKGEKGKRDSIIVVAQLYPEFTARLVDRWNELEIIIAKNSHPINKSYLPEYRKARAMELATRALDKMFANLPNLGEQSKQVIYADTLNPIAGKNIIPLPKLEDRTYTATEIGEKLGISANKVGRISKELNLKTEQYGIFVLDKSPYSDKQVETFRYNQQAIDAISLHLANGVAV